MAENTTPLSVFITGGSTGVGRALTRELVRRGHKVTGTTTTAAGAFAIRADGGLPTYPDLSRTADVRGLLQMAKADVLVHLAATPLNDNPLYSGDRSAAIAAVEATDELMIAAGQAGVKRLIYASFSFLYGNTEGHAATEETTLDTSNPLFKAAARAETAVLDGGIPGYVVRSGYIYGSGSEASRSLADELRRGQSILSGKNMASWIHEEDLASAIALLVELPSDEGLAELYNAADDSPASPDDFMKETGAALGTGDPSHLWSFQAGRRLNPLQKAMLATSVKMSSDRLKAAGWKPQFTNRLAGLDRMLMLWRAESVADAPVETVPERAIVTL